MALAMGQSHRYQGSMAIAIDRPARPPEGGGAAPARRLSVLLVEDHALVREGTRELLAMDPALRVIGEAERGLEAVTLAAELRPDLVVLDLGLPDIGGIEVSQRLRALPDPPHVLILSVHDDSDYVLASLRAGATGYMLKTVSASDLIAAVWACAHGEVVLHPSIARALTEDRRTRAGEDVLTGRETRVLALAAHGCTNKQIAVTLGISIRTVEAVCSSAFNKLGVVNRAEAVAQASTRGLIPIGPLVRPT